MTKTKKVVVLALLGTFFAAMSALFCITAPGNRVYAAGTDIGSAAVSSLGELDGNYRYLAMPSARIAEKSANSTQSGNYGIDKMFDNNASTRWEAAWNGAPAEKVFTFTFTQPETIVGFYEVTRNDNNISGTMSKYKIEMSDNGKNWQVAVENGETPFELGTWNAIFGKPVTAKYIRLTTDAAAISEFRFYYIPSAADDLSVLKDETQKLFASVEKGDAAGQYGEETYGGIISAKESAEAMAETSSEEIAAKAAAYLDLISQVKRGVNVAVQSEKSYETACESYRTAKAEYDNAVVGELPSQYPADAKEAFGKILNTVKTVLTEEIVAYGDYLDAVSNFATDYKSFSRAAVGPQIAQDSFAGNPNAEYLMDGTTEKRWQFSMSNNQGNLDGEHWITFDYSGGSSNEVTVDGITLAAWKGTKQGVKTFRLQYWNGTEWKNMTQANGVDTDGVFTVPDWTNSDSSTPTEYKNIEVKRQTAGKFRFAPLSVMPNANFCTIDELTFNIVAADGVSNAQAYRVEERKVILRWNAAENAESYKIYRYTDGKWTEIDELTENEYIDTEFETSRYAETLWGIVPVIDGAAASEITEFPVPEDLSGVVGKVNDDNAIFDYYSGSWTSQTFNGSYGNDVHWAQDTEARVSFRFYGDGFKVYVRQHVVFGLCDVTVDGNTVKTGVSGYNNGDKHQGLLLTVDGLEYGLHEVDLKFYPDPDYAKRKRYDFDFVEILRENSPATATFIGADVEPITGKGEIALPVAVSEGKVFAGWKTEGKLYAAESKYELIKDTVFEAVFIDFKLKDGAAVRFDRAGIRWTTYVDEEDYAALVKFDENVTFGMTLSSDSEHLTGTKFVQTEKWYEYAPEGYKQYNTALVDISEPYYATKFTAKGTIRITYADGETREIYSENEVTRSISEIASKALEDTRSAADEKYKYKTETGEYSPYSDEERAQLKKFKEGAE